LQAVFRGLPVLVTGATGFIGSHLVERLALEGARLRCLVRRTSRLEGLPPGVELAYADLAAGEGLEEAVRGARLVFHLAGVTKALSAESYYRGNALATAKLAAALACSEARLVHVSSLAAVGPSPDGSPLNEDAEPRPVSHYGRSKLEAERAVRDSAAASRGVIVRPPVVYGPRDTDVLELLRMAARGWMPVVGDPEARFSVIYVGDLVEGLLAAAACEQAAGRTYFLAYPVAVSWEQFARVAGSHLGRRPRLVRIGGGTRLGGGRPPAPAAGDHFPRQGGRGAFWRLGVRRDTGPTGAGFRGSDLAGGRPRADSGLVPPDRPALGRAEGGRDDARPAEPTALSVILADQPGLKRQPCLPPARGRMIG